MTPRIPCATYRLQFNPHFTFSDAQALLDYLHSLGITDLYASPIMMGGPEDLNGYQVTDHGKINLKLGGEEGLAELAGELAKRQMGLICDLVPNHMCIASEANAWWNDILENGPSSPYARYFDIDWDPPRLELKNQVLLPILGNQFGRVLESGELQIACREGSFFVSCYGRHLPMNPSTWVDLLESIAVEVELLFESGDPHFLELQSILTALHHLPGTAEKEPEKVAERHREKEIIKHRLRAVFEGNRELCAARDRVLKKINGKPGDPRSFDLLERLLEKQCYRLSFWRVANHEINYRRFFDINDLAGLRVEEFEVFLKVHELVFRMVRNGWVTGLRIDHVDGLFDPEKYLQELQQGCQIALATGSTELEQLFYVVVEKIFTGPERLRSTWQVHGTTGYDFLNLVGGLFVDPASTARLHEMYEGFGGWKQAPRLLVYSCKREVLSVALGSEWHVLARHLDRVSEQDRYSRDFTLENLQEGLREMIACFPTYRSYVRAREGGVAHEDRRVIAEAVRLARRLNPTSSPLIYDFIRSVLLLEEPPGLTEQQIAVRRAFVVRFQQLTSPVIAKGIEDTAFYRWYPLSSRNEVGGDPYGAPTSVELFHRENAYRARHWPHSMVATSTHDTKRSEDVRARLHVLSEIPDEWEQAIWRWRKLLQPIKKELEDEVVPAGNEEYLFYQAVLGAWPLTQEEEVDFPKRIHGYMGKATKEAKVHTSWINPDEAYDQLLGDFVMAALEPQSEFVRDLKSFLPRVLRPGFYNSLAQVVLKLAAPGVPDFYQGCERWNFSLVDPDNRRPVNFREVPAVLEELLAASRRDPATLARELFNSPEDGRIKLYVTALGLRLRREQVAVFQSGSYFAGEVEGKLRDSVIAFSRQLGQKVVIACVGRFFTRFASSPTGANWEETHLHVAAGQYRDVYTGRVFESSGELAIQDLFAEMPLALLVRD